MNSSSFGAVVIGRNEGARLRVCLESLIDLATCTVYVDSGSTDGSVEMATNMGVVVISLDMSEPFTAARARNAGFQHLVELNPDVGYVQFVDGDCEVHPEWAKNALNFMKKHQGIACACGRRRERFPEKTIYNLICDIEWDTSSGETKACGGDAMFRVTPFVKISGYRDDLIAGEEPELCVRLRQAGYKIWRLDEEMTLHDAEMTRFSQWWMRSIRGGYAFAEGAAIHGEPPEKHWVVESRRAILWALILPLFILVSSSISTYALLGLLLYPLQVLRIYIKSKLMSRRNALLYALFMVIGKFPEFIGQARFYWHRLTDKPSTLIEYK